MIRTHRIGLLAATLMAGCGGSKPESSPDASPATDAATSGNEGGHPQAEAGSLDVVVTADAGDAHSKVGPDAMTTPDGSDTGGSTFYVYENGALSPLWQKDYSFGTPVEDFHDTTHPEPGHTYDFSFSSPGGGGWQPVTTNYGGAGGLGIGPFGWDISPYTYMTLDLWPPSASDAYDMQWHYVGDVTGGTTDLAASAYVSTITNWAGPLTNGEWNRGLKIPLAALGQLGNASVYKFFFRDNTSGTNPLYLDNVGFLPGTFAWVYSGDTGPASGWSDASSGATADYSYQPADFSASLVSLNGPTTPGTSAVSKNVIALSVTSSGGMLKLRDSGGFTVSSFDHLTFGAVPTKSGYSYAVQLYDTSGTAIGTAVDPKSYTGDDQGTSTSLWTIYCIPLSAFGTVPASIGGLSIEDKSGASTNTLYFSAIGFYK
jgi:hypothetical protein